MPPMPQSPLRGVGGAQRATACPSLASRTGGFRYDTSKVTLGWGMGSLPAAAVPGTGRVWGRSIAIEQSLPAAALLRPKGSAAAMLQWNDGLFSAWVAFFADLVLLHHVIPARAIPPASLACFSLTSS